MGVNAVAAVTTLLQSKTAATERFHAQQQLMCVAQPLAVASLVEALVEYLHALWYYYLCFQVTTMALNTRMKEKSL